MIVAGAGAAPVVRHVPKDQKEKTMAANAVVPDAAAHVEELAQGPVSDVIYYPPPGSDDPLPPSGPPEPLMIWVDGPVQGQDFTKPASTGVVLTVTGVASPGPKDTIKEVRVRLGNAPSVVAPLEPANGWRWSTTTAPIRTAGPLTIRATVHATDDKGNAKHETSTIGVHIVLTDDVPPTVRIIPPQQTAPPLGSSANPRVITKNAQGKYLVPLQVDATDASGIAQVEFQDPLTSAWRPITEQNTQGHFIDTARVFYRDAAQHVVVQATDKKSNANSDGVWVRTKDTTAPVVTVQGDLTFDVPGQAGVGTVLPALSGVAIDSESGIASVRWGLNVPEPTAPVTVRQGSSWRIEKLTLPPGLNTVVVRATDVAGNVSAKTEIRISVTEAYPPVDPTVEEYLTALVHFAKFRLTFSGQPATVDTLTSQLHQPFLKLLHPGTARGPVAQLRLCIETLRGYFDRLVTQVGGPVPDKVAQAKLARTAAETQYRQQAYQAVLRHLGTSPEELTLAHHSGRSMRQALADRLGIELDEEPERAGRFSNNLQQLLLAPDAVDEAQLEALFGLVAFTRDPLVVPDTDPALLELQLRRLVAVWREQDRSTLGAVVDPDLIDELDLQAGANPAATLLEARREWLDALVEAMRQAPTPSPSTQPSLDRFDAIVAAVLGPVRELIALAARDASGEDIGDALEAMQLRHPAFRRLMAVRAIAAADTVTDPTDSVPAAAWEDVYAILVAVRKARVVEAWREAEYGSGLVLGPLFFQVGATERDGGPVSPWRVERGARRRWRSTLQGRVEHQRTLRQALASAIGAAEQDTLGQLRDGLVKALNVLTPATADSIGKRVMADVMTGPAVRITRVEHAIQSLQTLLVGVRTGTAPGWALKTNQTVPNFDEELEWMGSYANWYAAMQVFLFPENHLDPALRPPGAATDPSTPTPGFTALVRNLRKTRQLTPEAAIGLARTFNSGVFGPSFVVPRTASQLNAWRSTIVDAILEEEIGGTGLPALKALLGHKGLRERYHFAPLAVALQLHKSGQYLAALDWFRMLYAYDLPGDARKTYPPLQWERHPTPNAPLIYQRKVDWLTQTINAHDIVEESYAGGTSARFDAHTRFVVISIVRCLLDFAEAEFVQDTNESLPRARALYLQATELLAVAELNPPKVPGLTPNEVVSGLARRAQLGLAKIRTGRNAAGLLRHLETVAPVTVSSGSPLVVDTGPFGSSLRAFAPTPYRYTTLIERAKHLVGIAQQVEQSYLAALERYDAEQYNLFKAQQDLALAGASVALQDLRATEAADGVVLAERQQDRATYQVQAYQDLLDAPMGEWERKLLDDYADAKQAKQLVAGAEAALAIAQAVNTAASGGILGTGIGAGNVISAGFTVLSYAKYLQQVRLNDIETDIQRHSLHASIENRVREWTLQQGLARKDGAIADQQHRLALDHQAIVAQEGYIARLQQSQAQATVAFLTSKFTNVELYEWMIDVLQDVYGYFLRQATATATLAQSQLAFESQQAAPVLIRRDYWQPETDAVPGGTDPDRRGLTGSARLLQDIYQLDQLAFDTNQRKLQLTTTFSLARLAPAEFQSFRTTGVLPFATPLALFDRQFPGHYLRLIRRVRTSVVALVPPQQGIRATLTNAGVSKVVINDNSFQTVRLTRAPESVALTSPTNASGLFELDAQPELMLPFELSGVDSGWILEMPRAANQFDYRTIADVLFTVEYTALGSDEYRHKVIQELDRTVQASRSYSIRDDFPDLWYDLHDRARPQAPITMALPVAASDFPSNLDEIATENLTLFLVPGGGDRATGPVRVSLTFRPDGQTTAVGGPASSTGDGIVSTRMGNAPAWIPALDRSPFGEWTLSFPEPVAVGDLLAEEVISDIVLVLGYSGRTPAWPT